MVFKVFDNIQRLNATLFAVGFSDPSQRNILMARATARHILVSSEDKCNELKAAIEGGADFAEIAKEHSSCPSSRDGGNLGSFGPGQMVKEFDTVVFSAPVNVVQGPVKTQFGYHLLEVTSRQD
jgi:peptidyl-prolyl cis-trans isomerase C